MANDRHQLTPERVALAVHQLRPQEREALILSARVGLSNEEIAARLGLSVEAVERLLADTLVALDRALERQERPWWRFR
jgi:RNA polymerase sigma factor (sigma-70 family)